MRIPTKWAICTVTPVIKRKGDIRNLSCNRAGKLLELGIKVVERVLQKGILK